MKRLWLILLSFSLLSCSGKNANFHEVSNVLVYEDFALFYLKEGKVLHATATDNENYQYISPEELKAVKYILFENDNRILLEGTQEEGWFISTGRIPLNVKEVDMKAIFPLPKG